MIYIFMNTVIDQIYYIEEWFSHKLYDNIFLKFEITIKLIIYNKILLMKNSLAIKLTC